VTLLTATDLIAGYSTEVNILNGINLAVENGDIVTVIGPNGAGKSTLMKALCGLLRPRSGRITFDGEDITGHSAHSVVRGGIGYVPQLSNVFRTLTVEENLEVGCIGIRGRKAHIVRAAMYELFPRLHERRRQRAGTLSGGERQMLAMARALVREPRLLLLDEPSAGLSPALVDVVFAHVAAINESGVTILMVEQNARRALRMSTRAYVLDLGQNRYEGTGPVLLADPRVAQLYLGGLPRREDADD
jgi:branched-chain amino acid transport system ATP-binding protein